MPPALGDLRLVTRRWTARAGCCAACDDPAFRVPGISAIVHGVGQTRKSFLEQDDGTQSGMGGAATGRDATA